jgi:hypothetical protein
MAQGWMLIISKSAALSFAGRGRSILLYSEARNLEDLSSMQTVQLEPAKVFTPKTDSKKQKPVRSAAPQKAPL